MGTLTHQRVPPRTTAYHAYHEGTRMLFCRPGTLGYPRVRPRTVAYRPAILLMFHESAREGIQRSSVHHDLSPNFSLLSISSSLRPGFTSCSSQSLDYSCELSNIAPSCGHKTPNPAFVGPQPRMTRPLLGLGITLSVNSWCRVPYDDKKSEDYGRYDILFITPDVE